MGWNPDELTRELSEQMKTYIGHVKKWQWIWRRIPFVDAVYLGNSLTFNALHEDSDIDLFIVARPWRLWTVRLWTACVFGLLRLKRYRSSKMKFCLSFYVTGDAANLLPLKKWSVDPYLVYRISHLVQIYHSSDEWLFNIWEENSWISWYLPNFPLRQVINIWIEPAEGEAWWKEFAEHWSGWMIGSFFEILIRTIRLPVVLRKKRRLWAIWKDIVVSDEILKFHHDKRRKYSLLWKISSDAPEE